MKTNTKKEIAKLLEKYNVKINPDLNKYSEKIQFPEKVEKGKETIKRVGLPKIKLT